MFRIIDLCLRLLLVRDTRRANAFSMIDIRRGALRPNRGTVDSPLCNTIAALLRVGRSYFRSEP